MAKRQRDADDDCSKRPKWYGDEENYKLAVWMVQNPFREKKHRGGEKKKDWLRRMFLENGLVGRSADAQSSKETFLRSKYKRTKMWVEETGKHLIQTEGPDAFRDAVIKMCSWFWIFHDEMDEIQQYKPTSINGNDQQTIQVIPDIKHFFSADTEGFSGDDTVTSTKPIRSSNKPVAEPEDECNTDSSHRNPATIQFQTPPIILHNQPLASANRTTSLESSRTTNAKKPGNRREDVTDIFSLMKETKDDSESAAFKITTMQFEKSKWEHEERMMAMRLKELELQLKIKETELQCKCREINRTE